MLRYSYAPRDAYTISFADAVATPLLAPVMPLLFMFAFSMLIENAFSLAIAPCCFTLLMPIRAYDAGGAIRCRRCASRFYCAATLRHCQRCRMMAFRCRRRHIPCHYCFDAAAVSPATPCLIVDAYAAMMPRAERITYHTPLLRLRHVALCRAPIAGYVYRYVAIFC